MNLKNMRECDKSKNTCKQQLPIVYMSFNNVGHLITSITYFNPAAKVADVTVSNPNLVTVII